MVVHGDVDEHDDGHLQMIVGMSAERVTVTRMLVADVVEDEEADARERALMTPMVRYS